MFIVRTEDAMWAGPRINYFRTKKASTPEEALAEAREAMVDWAQDKLDRGEIQVEIYEISQRYVLRDGEIFNRG